MLSRLPPFPVMPAPERHALLQKYRTSLYTRCLKTVPKEKMLEMVQSMLTAHAPEIIGDITQQMEAWRELPVPPKTSALPVMVALVAFGDELLQSLLFFIFTYALQPTLVYTAFVKPPSQREFEMILLSKKSVDLDELEAFVEKLKMSVCVIPFSKYMSADMLESMNRLHYRGQMKIGNFQTPTAERVRRCFYYHMNKKRKEAREREVLLATGYAFTPSNMILVSNLLRQQRIENEAQRIESDDRAVLWQERIENEAHRSDGRAVFVLPLIHAWHAVPATP